MTHTTRQPRPRWRRAALVLTGLAVLVATAAGPAAADQGHAAHESGFPHYYPGGGHQSTPNDYPVPGVNYSTAEADLQPPPITVLKNSPHLARELPRRRLVFPRTGRRRPRSSMRHFDRLTRLKCRLDPS